MSGTRVALARVEAYCTLPDQARTVIDECIAEAWRNVESGDTEAHTSADVAADIAQRLLDVYGVKGHDDPIVTRSGLPVEGEARVHLLFSMGGCGAESGWRDSHPAKVTCNVCLANYGGTPEAGS